MSVNFVEGGSSSKTLLMDYFPLYMLFTEEEPDLLRHFNIIKHPSDCIEFACDYNTNLLLRVNLVLANSYSIVHEPLTLGDCPTGSFVIDLPNITEVKVFYSKIYDDGIEIVLSDDEPTVMLGSGDLRIGLTAGGDIARVFALNMSSDAIAHAKEEAGPYHDEN